MIQGGSHRRKAEKQEVQHRYEKREPEAQMEEQRFSQSRVTLPEGLESAGGDEVRIVPRQKYDRHQRTHGREERSQGSEPAQNNNKKGENNGHDISRYFLADQKAHLGND